MTPLQSIEIHSYFSGQRFQMQRRIAVLSQPSAHYLFLKM